MKPKIFMLFFLCEILILHISLNAQDSVLLLWDNDIPGKVISQTYKEELQIENGKVLRVKQVVLPTLSVFKPKYPNGTAMVIFPGGGYRHLSIDKEGCKIAQWLSTLGITSFVLKYRLPSDEIMEDKFIGPLQDAQRAIRYIRQNAKVWKLNPEQIGVIGFSAGGHLAATLSTQYEKKTYDEQAVISARPDFSILIYPVISMKDSVTHQGSKTNLLGKSPAHKKINDYSNELNVTKMTPRTFLVHSADDKSVPVENSLLYFRSLKKHGVPVEMHIYEDGGHGFGLGRVGTNQHWGNVCENWLRANLLID